MAEYNTNPLDEARLPHAKRSLSEAERIYSQGAPDYYSGEMVAPVNQNITSGWNQQLQQGNTALGLGIQKAGGIGTGLTGITSATDYLTQGLNGTDEATQALASKALAAGRQTGAAAGTPGGARALLAANTAATNTIQQRKFDFAKALADVGFASSGAVGETQKNLTQPGALQTAIGDEQRSVDQNMINADFNKYKYNRNKQGDWLNNYNELIAGGTQGGYKFDEQPSSFEKNFGMASSVIGLGIQANQATDGGIWDAAKKGGKYLWNKLF